MGIAEALGQGFDLRSFPCACHYTAQAHSKTFIKTVMPEHLLVVEVVDPFCPS
jgi:hypothetical protein